MIDLKNFPVWMLAISTNMFLIVNAPFESSIAVFATEIVSRMIWTMAIYFIFMVTFARFKDFCEN